MPSPPHQAAFEPRLIVALDLDSFDAALTLVRQLDPRLCRVKVGKELFTRCGPAILEQLHKLGFDVFLDLKFHDIPNTASAAVRAAADMGVWMVNVHASGGRRMLSACRDILEQGTGRRPWLIAVTVLTSMSLEELAETGPQDTLENQVLRLASLASQSGLDGVVCSAQEASMIKQSLGKGFKLITPGIRPAESPRQDQRRVLTPREALAAGSDFLVVGRPLSQAKDPGAALAAMAASLDDLS